MCEHNTTIVKYDQGNVQVEVCTWGCGQTLIAVKDASGLTHTFTHAELAALREEVERLRARNRRALEWLEHYPSQDNHEERAEANRKRAILILSGAVKVTR